MSICICYLCTLYLMYVLLVFQKVKMQRKHISVYHKSGNLFLFICELIFPFMQLKSLYDVQIVQQKSGVYFGGTMDFMSLHGCCVLLKHLIKLGNKKMRISKIKILSMFYQKLIFFILFFSNQSLFPSGSPENQ